MADESKTKVEFTPPKDFKPPENVKPGEEWDLVCSFRTTSDGKICMTKLGDADMPGYDDDHDEKDEPKHKPDYSEYSNGLMAQMGQGMATDQTSY